MKFYKVVLAAFLGTLIALLIVFFIKIGVITSLISSMSTTETVATKVKPNSILHMKLDYAIPDRTSENRFDAIDFTSIEKKDLSGLNVILRNIENAVSDPNIKGIYLNLGSVPTSSATLQEIRNKLLFFKESGKFIVSYGELYSQSAYYIASVSDKIFMNPDGMVDIHGMAAQITFYKHLMEKLGVEMQIIRGPNNKFKSAVEPYFLDKMSEANREQMDQLLGSVWGQILVSISQSRNISVEQLNRIADSLDTYFDAEKAIEYGLVDKLYYKDQVIDELRQMTGSGDKLSLIGNDNYKKCYSPDESGSQKIAIIYASGTIIDGKAPEGTIGSEILSRTIRKAREDKKVKAIVLRVNSPGGSALASSVIGREVELASEQKPVIVSMGNYAASGGYWISACSDYIFANANTLTGSIGVFGTIPNLKTLLNEKIGLTFDVAKTNANADFGSINKPLTEFQLAKLQQSVVRTYNDFTSMVARNRNLRQSYVDSIGQGRVWSGSDALQRGLVDKLGGLEDAIAYAAEKAGITDSYTVVEMPKQKDFMTSLMEEITGRREDEVQSTIQKELGIYYPYYQGLKSVSEATGIQARMPFDIIIE